MPRQIRAEAPRRAGTAAWPPSARSSSAAPWTARAQERPAAARQLPHGPPDEGHAPPGVRLGHVHAGGGAARAALRHQQQRQHQALRGPQPARVRGALAGARAEAPGGARAGAQGRAARHGDRRGADAHGPRGVPDGDRRPQGRQHAPRVPRDAARAGAAECGGGGRGQRHEDPGGRHPGAVLPGPGRLAAHDAAAHLERAVHAQVHRAICGLAGAAGAVYRHRLAGRERAATALDGESNPQGLQSLIQLLVRPVGEDVQKAVLSTICEIFYKKTSFDKSAADAAADTPALPVSLSSAEQLPLAVNHNLLDNYTVIILLAMIHCGILEALVTLGTGPSRALAEPAIDLLADILRMASRLLPDQHCASLLALPRLVSSTSLTTTTTMSLGDHAKSLLERLQREKSIRASEMLGELANAVGANSGSIATRGVSLVSYGGSGVNGVQLASELLRDTNRPSNLLALQQIAGVVRLPSSAGGGIAGTGGGSANYAVAAPSTQRGTKSATAQLKDSLTSRELMVLELKQSLDAQMDDSTFKDMLHNRSRGNKGYFSNLYWIPDHVPYLRPACQMYTLLLNHPEGLLFLKTDRRGQLLTEISSALELEARPEAAIVESHIGVLKARMSDELEQRGPQNDGAVEPVPEALRHGHYKGSRFPVSPYSS
ncbi:hypothetical protein ON010_g15228 [Phytophthora cinnamomi]|nr:hypothetical protein ON010_g15228 [Phytophthora cinnamomi]